MSLLMDRFIGALRRVNSCRLRCCFVTLFGLVACSGHLQGATNAPPADLTKLSIEELMNVEVTTVSKKAEKLSAAPMAIYVISAEDIRRSGVTSIPEALRLAPGLQVARVDAHNWAISARGFNDVFANKLLVMIDGRSVYTPLFSGVFWDVQDTMLEDIDRIEVIRGSGATLWGANAVNGVINIITKKAKDTQGFMLIGGGGTEEIGFGGLRYGGKAGENAWFRVYAKHLDRDDFVLANGTRANDGWRITRGGFRMDWEPSAESTFTLQGDAYGGQVEQTFFTATPAGGVAVVNDGYSVNGGNVLARWTRQLGEGSDLQAQFYFDRTLRDTAIFGESRNTFDADVQYRVPLGERNTFVAGLGYRVSHDQINNTFTTSFTQDSCTTHLFSLLLRDEIVLVPDKVKLIAGARLEHNSFTGFEIQPDARLLWTPTDRLTVYASASRAVRTPSRAEDDVRLNTPGPFPGTITSIFGSRRFDSETLMAYEAGFRLQAHERVFFGIAPFYYVYDNLRTFEPGVPGGLPVVIPFTVNNNMSAETYGFETGPRWRVTDGWFLQATYSFVKLNLHRTGGSGDPISEGQEGRTPQHQLALRSFLNLGRKWDVDCGVRYVDGLPNLNIPSYVVMDARIAWRPTANLEISVVGQNLLDDRHPEFAPSVVPTQPTQVQHGVYGKVVWRF